MIDEGRAIFLQIAELIESSIVDGSLAEEERAPSTNELAAFHRINPATAAKGLGLLVDRGILYKQRGIGMFVATGARQALIAERRAAFADRFVEPLLAEARTLGLTPDDVAELVRSRSASPASARDPASGSAAASAPAAPASASTTAPAQEGAPA